MQNSPWSQHSASELSVTGTPAPDVPVGDLLASLGVTGPSGPESYGNSLLSATLGAAGPSGPEPYGNDPISSLLGVAGASQPEPGLTDNDCILWRRR
jgi:hypothetical protein